jgi:O-antigen/teichoic acid export membrane protein
LDPSTDEASPPTRRQGDARGLFGNAASILMTSLVASVAALGTSVVLARALGAGGYGYFAIITSFSGLAMLVFQFGWTSATVYRIRRERVPPDRALGAGIAAMLAVSVVATLAGLCFERPVIERLVEGAPAGAYRLGLALVSLQLFGLLFVAVLRAMDRFRQANIYRFVRSTGTLLLVSALVLVGTATLELALVAVVAANATATLLVGVSATRVAGWSPVPRASDLSASLRFGVRSQLQTLAGNLHERVDILMLALLGVEESNIAFYAVAVSIVDRLKMLPEAIANALYPEVAERAAEAGAALTARAVRNALLCAALVAAGIGAASVVLVPILYGAEFAESLAPIFLLLPGSVLLTNHVVLGRYFTGLGRQRVNIVTQLASTSFNVVANLLLIPPYGILGAALASLLSYALQALLILSSFVRMTSTPLSQVLWPQRSDWPLYRRALEGALRRVRGQRSGPEV